MFGDKRVLVTTALEETFPKDKNEKILFLGEWCKLYSKKDIYAQYDYKTLPYHWDDRKKLYEDTKYIDEIYELYLSRLTDQLNMIHNVSYSLGYWRIILGPWLRYFIEMVYNRYLSIEKASKENINYAVVVDINDKDIVPRNMMNFNQLYIDDIWNQFIYQSILKYFDIKVEKKQIDINKYIKNSYKSTQNLKQKIKNFLFFLNKFNKIHFFSAYIKLPRLWLLQLYLKQIPSVGATQEVNVDVLYSSTFREKLFFSKSDSKFLTILNELIPRQIPLYYMEGYHEFRKKTLSIYPKNARVIFTANAYSGDDGFKFWTAEMKEKGAKYIIGQHGGNYGMGLFASHEIHQIKSADKFFSWGWKKDDNKVVSVSAVKLKQKIQSNPIGDILILMMSTPRYSYHIMAMPSASQILYYLNDQLKFLEQLDDSIKNLVKLRIYQNDYKWSLKQRIIDKGFCLNIDSDENLNKTFIQRLSECRLCISTYNATTYLETFAANYPTLLYWDEKYWELNDYAKPCFKALQDVGILHFNAESLTKKLNEIYNNPLQWWNSTEVQNTIRIFCEEFANTKSNYLNDYTNKFGDLLNARR